MSLTLVVLEFLRALLGAALDDLRRTVAMIVADYRTVFP